MPEDAYRIARWHEAEIRGERYRFATRFKHGTNGFWSAAVQACKDAGLYLEDGDASLISVDGMQLR